jgi:hypothetical protein
MNKIFNLISTKLLIEKETLETELEEVLNNRQDLEFNVRLDKSLKLIKEISTVMTTIGLWESYNNNLKEKNK